MCMTNGERRQCQRLKESKKGLRQLTGSLPSWSVGGVGMWAWQTYANDRVDMSEVNEINAH